VQPHIALGMRGVAASQPLPDGSFLRIGVNVRGSVGGGDDDEGGDDEDEDAVVVVDVAKTVDAELRISEVLVARMLRLVEDGLCDV
jgi:hypothetical protein